jgi:hypothetical protein
MHSSPIRQAVHAAASTPFASMDIQNGYVKLLSVFFVFYRGGFMVWLFLYRHLIVVPMAAAAAERCSYTTDARRDRRGLSLDEAPAPLLEPAGLVLRTTFPVPDPEDLPDCDFSSGFFGRALRGP